MGAPNGLFASRIVVAVHVLWSRVPEIWTLGGKQACRSTMSKKLTGFDRELRVWRDSIFSSGFEAGAKARVAAGIPSPPGEMPKRSARVPDDYPHRNASVLWARGWKMGYAIGTPNAWHGSRRKHHRTHAWERELAKRGPLRIRRPLLVGCWRATRRDYVKVWSLAHDGSLTGRITKASTVITDASGTWKVDKDCLIFDYRSDLYGGEMNAPYEDTSVILDITRARLVIATGETIRERYTHVPQKI
jgi:hypothetical protein